eukprot:SAG22_NODE_2458_length_2550_cov_1.919625_1_plen_215_part_10
MCGACTALLFLDADAAVVTPEQLSDLQNAALYHAATTKTRTDQPAAWRPRCSLIELAHSEGRRLVHSRQGVSNITGDRTCAVLPAAGYAAGSVSEDFEAVFDPAENSLVWAATSKELSIELKPPVGWDLASSVWPSVTLVVDEKDAPWGLARPIINWSKPTHLRSRIGVVQHTAGNMTVLLATADVDAAQLSPPTALHAASDRERAVETSPGILG